MTYRKDFQPPLYEFYMRHPYFWYKISMKPKMTTYAEMENYVETFDELCNIAKLYVCNFNDIDLEKINVYLCEIVAESTGIHNALFEKALKYTFHIRDYCAEMDQRMTKMHDEIVRKIDKTQTILEKGEKIMCPLDSVYLSYNYLRISYINSDDPYAILWTLRKTGQTFHYYIMMYVCDISLRMHTLKNDIIKLELARKGSISGTALDIVINEMFLSYNDYNKELRKYSKIMDGLFYYSNHSCMCPEIMLQTTRTIK